MAKDTFKVNTKELNELADKLAKAATTTEKNVSEAVTKFAFLVDHKAKEKLKKRGKGRVYEQGKFYPRGGGGGVFKRELPTHQASAEGDPPSTDSGRLVSSIRPVLTGRMSAEVGSLSNIAVYGGMLEEGTKNMAARPWLEPTLRENEGALQGLFTAAIKTGGLAD